MPEGDERDRRVHESGIGAAGAEAEEATGQIPVGPRRRKERLDKEADASSGGTAESVRRALEAGAHDKD